MPFVPDAPQQPRFVPDAPAAPKPNPVTGTPSPERRPPLEDIGGGGVMGALAASPQNVAAEAAGGLSGIAGAVLPGPAGQGAKWSEKVSGALSAPAGNKAQQTATKVLGLPGELWGNVANWVGERGSSVPAIGAFGKGAAEVLPSLVGARTGVKPRAPLTLEQSRVAAARDAGFKMTPEDMGAGAGAQATSGLAGEPKIAKAISKDNVGAYNDKIAADLGLPKGSHLDADTLKKVEHDAWDQYAAVRKVGKVETDPKYGAALDKLEETFKSAAADFPEAAQKLGIKDTQEMVAALRKPAFDANSAVDLIRQLRSSADGAYASGNGGYAKVLRGAAQALEDQIDRHLAPGGTSAVGGQADLVSTWRTARQRLAMVHEARKSLAGGENINPRTYAKTLEKKPDLLTGGGREVAQFATNFPRSAQKLPTGSINAPTWSDALLGAVSGGGQILAHGLSPATALPVAGAVLARPAARAALTSRGGQALMDPRTNLHTLEALGIASVPRPQEESR